MSMQEYAGRQQKKEETQRVSSGLRTQDPQAGDFERHVTQLFEKRFLLQQRIRWYYFRAAVVLIERIGG